MNMTLRNSPSIDVEIIDRILRLRGAREGERRLGCNNTASQRSGKGRRRSEGGMDPRGIRCAGLI